MAGLVWRVAGGHWPVRAIEHDALKASALARTLCARWGGAGLVQRQALAASAISTLAEAHLFGRRVGVVDDVDGVHIHKGHLVELPHGREDVPKSVRAGLKVGVEMVGAAAGAPYQVGNHPTSGRLMVGT